MNVNEVTLIGRLTEKPELKSTTNGNNVSSFTVATNRVWKDKEGDKQEETQFTKVVAWGKQAETIAQYFIKGQEIYVRGRLQTRKYEDKEGNTRYATEVVLERFEFGQKPKGAQSDDGWEDQPAPEEGSQDDGEEINPDDIPF
jgi:single-strand DNA-binding protein